MEGLPDASIRRWVVLGSALVVVVGLAGPAWADLEFDNELTYIADTANGQVVFVTDLTLLNNTPDQTEGATVTQFFFDHIELLVPREATSIEATSGSRGLAFETLDPGPADRAEGLKLISVSLGRRLFFNEQMNVRVVYRVRGDEPRSETLFRVNPAYFSVPITAWGDPGKVDVDVVVPIGWELTFEGDSLFESDRTSQTATYTANDITDVDGFFVHVTGTDNSGLSSKSVEYEGISMLVRSWPGDDFWSDTVSSSLSAGLPWLLDLVGLEWAAPDSQLVLSESAEVTRLGYGGRYIESENRIEIGEWIDAPLVLHEVSHVWFNDGLFDRRWITEGLAEEYSVRAAVAAGLADGAELRPASIPATHPMIPNLNEWSVERAVQIDDLEELNQYESYGYEASFWLIQELTAEIGVVAMSNVLQAAADDIIAYRGEPEPESVPGVDSWNRFLDLLEEVGGSEIAGDLFAAHVSGSDLGERARARDRYDEVEVRAAGWKLPYAIRKPMSDWDFPRATELLEHAKGVLDAVDDVAHSYRMLGLELPQSIEDAFESEEIGFDESVRLTLRMEGAADAVLAAKAVKEVVPDIFERIGLIGDDVDAEYLQAIAALDGGDFEAAETESAEVLEILESARGEGVLAVGILATGSALIAAAGVALRRRSTRAADDL